ncbi:MAG: asparagine synthase-related protein [Kiritimatiellia bacterium]
MPHSLVSQLEAFASRGVCLALSGGVDSALLLALLAQCQHGRTHAVTLQTFFQAPEDIKLAHRLAALYGIEHSVLSLDFTHESEILANRPDRCYLCKTKLFRALKAFANAHQLAICIDGTNAEDLTHDRPGLRALQELEIRSPLAECGMTKADIRTLARELALPVAERPSAPCRIAYIPKGTPIPVP